MGTTRRGFIRIVGGSAVVVGASGYGFASTRTPEEALAPWGLAGGETYSDPRMRALSYAILAPNPHNRQPWMVDLSAPGEATLYCDLERLLPETDPPSRQITIGLGCFLELLRMAAAEEGVRADITPFPEGMPEVFDGGNLDTRPVAHIRFTEGGATPDPLFKHVLARRSLKEPFDVALPVTDGILTQLESVVDENVRVGSTNDPARVEAFRDLTWRGHYVEMMTPHTLQESVDLMRIGKKEINANPDGIDLGGFFLEGLALIGQLDREQLADPQSAAFKQGMDMYKAMLESAMGYVWLMTQTNTRADQLRTGANWLRVNLKATSMGLGLHPLSQTLQEYPEMTELFGELHGALGVDIGEGSEARVQMFGRLGYGPEIAGTPRWRAETRLL